MGAQNSFYAEVGRLIRDARSRAGLTQDALAARVSLSRTSVTDAGVAALRKALPKLKVIRQDPPGPRAP